MFEFAGFETTLTINYKLVKETARQTAMPIIQKEASDIIESVRSHQTLSLFYAIKDIQTKEYELENLWRYECTFKAERIPFEGFIIEDPNVNNLLKEVLEDAADNTKNPWIIINHLAPELAQSLDQNFLHAESIVEDNVINWQEINISPIYELLDLEMYTGIHPFEKLYGLDGQIRMILTTVYQAIRTHGRAKSHIVLYGSPGCGKTTITEIIEKLVTPNAVLKIDATKTTRAGLENLVFNELEVFPPIVLLEEAEKSNPDDLAIWLGVCDHRNEIRKVTSRGAMRREVNSLLICTVNDIDKFNKLNAGALSSRCATKVYFPNPSEDTLRKILIDYAQDNTIENPAIEQVLKLAQALKQTDPRILCGYLLHSTALHTGHFQRDLEQRILAEQAAQ
jgi:SpoVK/Ycf46/Vps4 family AAA+-type ATPase